MSQSLRDQLARSADEIGRPAFDVADLVARAEGRLRRRRLVAGAAGAVVVTVVTVGGLALRSDDRTPSPAPLPPPATSETQSPEPAAAGPAIYFDALQVDGDEITDPSGIAGPKDLYLTRGGGSTRQVLATDADEHCPRVSPDGRRLAYLEGGRTVVVRRLDPAGDLGATEARVRYDGEGITCPQWSVDGGRIAVGVADYQQPDQVAEVHVIERDGTERLVATRRDQYMPLPDIAWSPAGDAIAFTTPDSVWVAPLGDGEPTRAWRGQEAQDRGGLPPSGTPQQLAWLPTGEILVSVLETYTSLGQDETLHIVDPGSGRDRVVGTFAVTTPETWTFSPDGSRLAYADSDGGVRTVDLATGTSEALRPMLDGTEVPVWKLVWSPDGRRLVGTAADADQSTVLFALISMRPDGSGVQVLTPWTLALYSEADVSWSSR